MHQLILANSYRQIPSGSCIMTKYQTRHIDLMWATLKVWSCLRLMVASGWCTVFHNFLLHQTICQLQLLNPAVKVTAIHAQGFVTDRVFFVSALLLVSWILWVCNFLLTIFHNDFCSHFVNF